MLLGFVIPPIASQILVFAAGLMRGQATLNWTHTVTFGVFVLQVLIVIYLVWKLDGARWAAGALGIFAATYAAFASLVAGMSFQDTWL
jgi:hypothetical protein